MDRVIFFLPAQPWWTVPHLHAQIADQHIHPARMDRQRYRRLPDGSIRLLPHLAAAKAARKTRAGRRRLKATRRAQRQAVAA